MIGYHNRCLVIKGMPLCMDLSDVKLVTRKPESHEHAMCHFSSGVFMYVWYPFTNKSHTNLSHTCDTYIHTYVRTCNDAVEPIDDEAYDLPAKKQSFVGKCLPQLALPRLASTCISSSQLALSSVMWWTWHTFKTFMYCTPHHTEECECTPHTSPHYTTPHPTPLASTPPVMYRIVGCTLYHTHFRQCQYHPITPKYVCMQVCMLRCYRTINTMLFPSLEDVTGSKITVVKWGGPVIGPVTSVVTCG
mmetsp:Transcript_30893/g.49983  ORF Transcript_30893/g.49983 Transcript_30893/m.49983 type:complete len:247 (-) Transcript_30893:763-1503(-)